MWFASGAREAVSGPCAGGRGRSLAAVAECGMLALLIASGALVWGIGIAHRSYDYDEVQRAHSVWLVSQGLSPYTGFFEVHPPYFSERPMAIAVRIHPPKPLSDRADGAARPGGAPRSLRAPPGRGAVRRCPKPLEPVMARPGFAHPR
jgi:hypothetical protein